MFEFNAAYRHADGMVEGFVGCGFTAASAKAKAYRAMVEKCEAIGQAFDDGRMITSASALTKDELAIIRADWRMVAC